MATKGSPRTSKFAVGDMVTVDTQGMRIPGHDARTWRYAAGEVIRVHESIAQYSYSIRLTLCAPGEVVSFVSAYSMRAV